MSDHKRPKGFKLRTSTLFLRRIRSNVKAFFKAYCAKRGISMNSKIEQLMIQCIREDNVLRFGKTLEAEDGELS